MILAILAAIAVPAVLGYVEDVRKAQYIAEARSIYLVIQTETEKVNAQVEANGGKYPIEATNPEKYYNPIINEKISDLKNISVDYVYIGSDTSKYPYKITWTSSRNRVVTEKIEKNKKDNKRISSIKSF